MDPAQYQRVKDIVAVLIEVEPSVRAAQLRLLCGGDEKLRREAESLLAANDEADDFLNEPASSYVNPPAEIVEQIPPPDGWRIGPYRVLREIGSGGMGVVYEAVRDDEFRKQVAIKIVKPGMDTAFILRRFRSERGICATLSHPNIAMLLDGGSTAGRQPYFAMEYVEGEPIDSYCNRRSLSVRKRLELFRAVCGAVHYAHQNLVVHRDLKPSNILVTKEGIPKLLDFGIAKILGAPDFAGAEGMTAVLPVMTPDYASPEQVLGETVTTATDVYSLGAILFEVLSRKRAHRFQTRTPQEIRQVICEQEPVAPSEACGNRELRGDLDNIILKAMHRDPLRRYSSAEALAQDIDLFLSGRPVRARKDTLAYRAGKFVQRHKTAVTATALVVLSIIGGILATARQAGIAARERQKAERRFNALFPSTRCCMGMASSGSNQSGRGSTLSGTLLFGGFDGTSTSTFGDTWIMQEGGWFQLNPPNAPSPRAGAAIAYDAATGTFVMFGGTLAGQDGGAVQRTHYDETWIWNGKTWTQHFPPVSPPARRFDSQGMVYDPRTETVVLFGGMTANNTVLGDTWSWDGKTKTWTQRPVAGPSPRRAPIAYDGAKETIVLFGGDDGTAPLGDTWEWRGSNWVERFPKVSPPPRAMASMVYDAAIRRVVLFGGVGDWVNSRRCPYNDAWTWNGISWTQQYPTNVPLGRFAAGMVYDPTGMGELIFGGFGCGYTLGDTKVLRIVP